MTTSILASETNVVFPAIHNVYQSNFLLYKAEESKDFSIYFLQKQVEFIKIELRDKTLSRIDKLRLLDLLSKFSTILEALTDDDTPEVITYDNIEDYPPYHLHKKSQSAFEMAAK